MELPYTESGAGGDLHISKVVRLSSTVICCVYVTTIACSREGCLDLLECDVYYSRLGPGEN